jgi:hypothetical protein
VVEVFTYLNLRVVLVGHVVNVHSELVGENYVDLKFRRVVQHLFIGDRDCLCSVVDTGEKLAFLVNYSEVGV